MINIKDFDLSLLKIDKKSFKNIVIHDIRYITIKTIDDHKNIHSVNPLYLMIGKIDGHIEEKNGSEYLVFDFINEKKGVLKNKKNFGMGLKMKLRP